MDTHPKHVGELSRPQCLDGRDLHRHPSFGGRLRSKLALQAGDGQAGQDPKRAMDDAQRQAVARLKR